MVALPPRCEHVITVGGEEGERAAFILKQAVSEGRFRPLSLFAFGGACTPDPVAHVITGDGAGVSRLRGDSCRDRGAESFQMFAISGVGSVQVIQRANGVGFVYDDKFARYCRLSAVVPVRLDGSREDQAREVLETAEGMLGEGGFRFNDTVRTWFYLDRLLEWYDVFNAVRTGFFRTRGVFDAMVPASTGIGAGNARGGALTCDLLAIRPRGGGMSIQAVPSPMQESALNYRSSFSRAVEIRTSDYRQLLISGTASIDKEGRTVHAGDSAAQVELTMQVVEALLESRGMGWNDVTRGIVYLKRMMDRPLFDRCLRERGIAPFPLAVAEADVCRDDLDFEIEVDAVQF